MMMMPYHHYILFTVLLSFLCPVLAANVYGIAPTCGPELSFSILTITGSGFLDQNITINVGQQSLDSSFTLYIDNTTLSFLTPKNLTSGIYDVQICSEGPLFNCSYVCSNCSDDNCTTPDCYSNSTNPSTCCQEECILLNTTTSCLTTTHYVVYAVPPILTSVFPSTVTHKGNVSLVGHNFISCGINPTVRVQSVTAIQDIHAAFNSANEILFYVDHSIASGVISLSLDGQHFDSLSISPITLTNSLQYDSDSQASGSEGSSPGGPQNLIWLFIVLGIAAVAAGAFLVYVIYRHKKNEYSRLYEF